MTSTYPKTAPLVSITHHTGLLPSHINALNCLIRNTIKEKHGEEVVFEITSMLQEQLDQYESNTNSESLEDQRKNRMKVEEQKRKAEEEAERHKQELEVREEERMLDLMVQDELRRRKDKDLTPELTPQLSKVSVVNSNNDDDYTSFDRVIAIRTYNGTSIQFKDVRGKIPTRVDFFGKHYIVKPVVDGPEVSCDVSMLLTEIQIDDPYWITAEGKPKVFRLENEIETVRKFHHESIVPLYASKIFRQQNSNWQIFLLSEYSSMGTMSDLLDTIGTVTVKKAKAWAIQLLDAIEYIHKTGVAHKLININNIALYKNSEMGETVVKLQNCCFGQKLIEMNNEHPFTSRAVNLPTQVWQPPELSKPGAGHTKKCDIFNFGVAFAEMIAGKSITTQFQTPQDFLDNNEFSTSLKEFFTLMFKPVPKKRSSALDLLTCTFLRLDDESSVGPISSSATYASASFRRRSANRARRSTSGDNVPPILQTPMYSRYAHDFDESSSLGRGAFGEVVKARNKLDGRFYAIKKIHATKDKLSSILQEVWLLSRLNHQYVVRYFGAWLEDDLQVHSDAVFSDDESENETESMGFYSNSQSQFKKSDISLSAPLSFMSQSMHDDSGPDIEFGYSSCEESSGSESGETEESSETYSSSAEEESSKLSGILTQRRPKRVPTARSTLFIQMEYCEKHTLGDLISGGLYSKPDEYWRLFRQSLEALNHIHNEGIIHRDLKPTNIFIDQAHNVKVGDFGLAKSIGQNILLSANTPTSAEVAEELTTEVGTYLYIANEMLGKEPTSYDAKVDMYSMGIIFFEMVYHMATGSERLHTLRELRKPSVTCPGPFMTHRYDTEREIVCKLVDHRPAKRPSARELLDSKLIPAPQKDEMIRETLQSIIDTKSDSPWISQVYSALFSKKLDNASTVLYDRFKFGNLKTTSDYMLYTHMAESVTRVFRRHGAVDNDDRANIFPCSTLYDYPNLVKLMDPSGNILQLPYDLTLPFASKIAERPPPFQKSFHFGHVYRTDDKNKGSQPRKFNEICFDIVSASSADSDLHEAESIKVLEEVVDLFPCFKPSNISIYINHTSVLDSILRHCTFREHQTSSALMLLGQSGIGPAQPNIKQELLSTYSLSSTALNDLELFGFRDDVDRAETKLFRLMGNADFDKSFRDGIANIRAVISYLHEMGVTKRIFFAPLSNYNAQFYKGGIMFQVVCEDKKRVLLAAGGRYDSLVKRFRHPSLDKGPAARAVGFNMPSDRIMDYFMAYRDLSNKKRSKKSAKFLTPVAKQDTFNIPPRCDVLISSFNVSNTKTLCLRLLQNLWNHNIGADFVSNCISSEELVAVAEKEGIDWCVIVKQQSSFSTSSNFKPLRLKTISTKVDVDLDLEELVPHIMMMISERDRTKPLNSNSLFSPRPTSNHISHHHSNSMSKKFPIPFDKTLLEGPSSPRAMSIDEPNSGASKNVTILSESGKIKGGKKNRWLLEETAKSKVNSFVKDISNAPVYSLDVKDEVMDAICATSPTQAEEWKRRVVGLSPSLKKYIMDIQTALAKEALRNTPFVLLCSTKSDRTCIYNLQQR